MQENTVKIPLCQDSSGSYIYDKKLNPYHNEEKLYSPDGLADSLPMFPSIKPRLIAAGA